jgi:hypothetical protein
MAARRLADVNLKLVLAEAFAAPTLRSTGLASVVAAEPNDALLMHVAPSSPALQVDITGYSFGRQAITFQRMVVPPTGHAMKIDFNPPDAAPPAAAGT